MFVVGSGETSGTVVRRLVHELFVVSLTRHTAAECEAGLHVHERPHLSLVLRGGDVEQRGHERYTRGPGALGFYDAGEAHASLSRAGDSVHANIEFAQTLLDQLGITASEVAAALHARVDAPLVVLRTQAELQRNDVTSPLAIEELIIDLITAPLGARAARRPAWVARLHDLLQDSWARPVTLASLAAEIGVHPVTISKHFPRYFGTTLSTWLRQLRLTRSLPLLGEPHQPLSGVAYHCGFADQSHYTRLFRQQTGFSPGAVRRL